MKKKIIGYTTGVFDLFHVGHVNLLRNAKAMCDFLIVGVTTDKLVSYKHKQSVIPFKERFEIVQNSIHVDMVVPQYDMDKVGAHKKLKFDKMFVGDDWYGTKKWEKIEKDLSKCGVQVVYFPYTEGTSSTLINSILEEKRDDLKNKKKGFLCDNCEN